MEGEWSLIQAAEAAMTALPQPPVFARVDLVDLGASVRLMELELIEPELFITLAPGASYLLDRAIRVTLDPRELQILGR